MIGRLPKTLTVLGTEYKIRTDYRDILNILRAFNDINLTDIDKAITCLKILFLNYDLITNDNVEEALKKANWFILCGKESISNINAKQKIMDWEQDEQIIFSAVNKIAGKEVRELEYMHWWTFMSLFNEIGDGTFASVVAIRQKKAKGKKLEKYEQEFYRNNKELIDLKKKYTQEEQVEIDRLNKLLNS